MSPTSVNGGPSGERLRRKAGMVYLQVKPCDPCLSALRYTYYVVYKWPYINIFFPFLFFLMTPMLCRHYVLLKFIVAYFISNPENNESMKTAVLMFNKRWQLRSRKKRLKTRKERNRSKGLSTSKEGKEAKRSAQVYIITYYFSTIYDNHLIS